MSQKPRSVTEKTANTSRSFTTIIAMPLHDVGPSASCLPATQQTRFHFLLKLISVLY